jgi:phage tail protein X
LADTREYISARLKIAGAKGANDIFSESAIRAIYQYAEGYPRMINILADSALLLGYSKGKSRISSSMVGACHEDMKLGHPILSGGFQKPETPKIKREEGARINRWWKWAAVLLFVMLASTLVIAHQRDPIFERLAAFIRVGKENPIDKISKKPVPATKKVVRKTQESSAKDSLSEKSIAEKPSEQPKPVDIKNDTAGNRSKSAPMALAEETAPKKVSEQKVASSKEPVAKTPSIAVKKKVPLKTLVVKQGDTLAGLSERVYGRVSVDILKLIRRHNPEITNVNQISVGQQIVFPSLPSSSQALMFTVHVATFERMGDTRDLFQSLIKAGYEAYIMPMYHTSKGKLFRVTIGNFTSLDEAKDYATSILRKGVSDHAEPIRIAVR